jgi:hypothetical protein
VYAYEHLHISNTGKIGVRVQKNIVVVVAFYRQNQNIFLAGGKTPKNKEIKVKIFKYSKRGQPNVPDI